LIPIAHSFEWEKAMLPIGTILHPTDFSDRSRNALVLASSLARDYGAHLILLHVLPQPIIGYGEGVIPPDIGELRAEARDELSTLTLPDFEVAAERQLVEGDPAAMILKAAHDEQADIIVMGTHGRSGIGRLIMGSVAETVMRKSHCPVLTVTAPFPPHVETGTFAESAAVGAPL
jgi:nucleotide-binding universal stress UspA family protein